MYELSRIRLHSVGPKGARYQDVMIDLRDVGAPVPRPAPQALFEIAPAAPAVLCRPSPATVMFLENGGGKTVLMKLIFSVMLPGRRNVLGSSNTRVLEDYVLAGDVAHVDLEWQHTRTGERVVTAKVCEWRGHTVSSDPGRLAELWYTFRPTARFNLDTLPLTVDGRLVTLAGFRDRLSEAGRAEPQLQAAWETNHRDWVTKLENLGLDPELFRYQRAMNAGEGEAADAFTFKTDEAFVEFLLRAVTDDEDPRGLAEVVSGYAGKLSQRTALLSERDFVAGALGLITPLTDCARDATAAGELAQKARRDAERLAGSLVARHREDAAQLASAEEESNQTASVETLADQEVRRLGAVVLELKRLVTGLRLAQAEQAKRDLETRRTRASVLLAAWQATEIAVASYSAHATAEAIREVVHTQEDQARPALLARDRAARALARGLLFAAERAEAEQAAAEAAAALLDDAAGDADSDGQDAIRRSEQSKADAKTAQARIEEVQEALRAAVDDGIIDNPAHVHSAADEAREGADRAATARQQAWEHLDELTDQRKTTAENLATAQREEITKAAVARQHAERLQAATDRTEALAGQPRLAALLGTATVDLDIDAAALLERLRAAVATAEDGRATLQLAQSADERILTALGDGGLLPASQPVCDAVEVLEADGITAWPGWSYLAQLPPDERDLALLRYPHLVDGVVVNNPDRLEQANRLLVEARLMPAALVAVGTTADMHRMDVPHPAGLEFIVPPNPAMYDEQAAAGERQRLADLNRERTSRLRDLETDAEADRTLAESLRAWQRDYPSGALSQLAEASRTAEVDAATTRAQLGAADKAAREAARAEQVHQRLLPDLYQAATKARQRAERLVALASHAEQVPTWAEQVRAAREATTDAERELRASRHKAIELRGQAVVQRDVAGDHRRIRDTSHDELARLPGGGSVDTDEPVPAEPLAELRERHRTAHEAYLKVEVGQDLLAELRSAEQDEAKARAAWEAQPADVRTRATALLQTPDGADAAARAAATARTNRDLDNLGQQIVQTADEVGRLSNEYEGFTPQDRSLEPYGKPRDIAHGDELVATASADHAEARRRLDDIKARREALDSKIAQSQRTVDAFSSLVDSLADVAPGTVDEDALPFADDVAVARERRNDARKTLTHTDALLSEANAKVREAADALAQYAADPQFQDVSSPVRRQIVAVNRERLPEHAADWQAALKPRLRTLEDDLAQIDEHRSSIITRLHGMADTALATLRSAQRLSKLPRGMGDWSGQEFLRIRFSEADPAALRERLGQVVDEAAVVSESRGGDKPRRSTDGLSLLLQAVRASMPKGVTVEMLKPDAVLRTERVRVASISDVFSGGQLLTAAIVLYCTMAALRANERGHAHHPHAGVLFLDNPIGRASAGYLLEVQLAVADALNVQLIYTTGLFDTNALAVFPLIVRLRNDADLRAGLKYLSVDNEMRRPLDKLTEPDDTGRVTTTRIFVRPRPAAR